MSDPKFCKDCKHFKQYEGIYGPYGPLIAESNCEHPSLRDVVTGNQESRSARVHRMSFACGADAKQFEAGDATPGIYSESRAQEKARVEEQRAAREAAYAKLTQSYEKDIAKAEERRAVREQAKKTFPSWMWLWR